MVVLNIGATRSSYRLAWAIWIGFSLIHATVYFLVATSPARIAQGQLFAAVLLLQAIWIPFYVSRKEFTGLTQAAIRSAAAAAAFGGLAASILILTGSRLGTIATPGGLDPLQSGYLATTLLLSGLAGGTTLGILRWRILQAQEAQSIAQPTDSWWRLYLSSSVLWAACVTVYLWWICAGRWAAGDSGWRSSLGYVVALAAAGLLLMAPIPVLFPAREGEIARKRIWRYLKYWLAVLFVVLLLASPFLLGIYLLFFPMFFLAYAAAFLPPVLSWIVLYVRYVQTPKQTAAVPDQRISTYQPLRLAPPGSRIVWWGVAGQAGALLVGLAATVPVSLGFHGIGCRSASSMGISQYWFWKAYKGYASESSSGDRMFLRPAVDSSVCLSLDPRQTALMSDPRLVSAGYVGAARAWAWLIDPEQWDSPRTREIRKELARLLGRDFSSYQELETWWKENNRNLVWSGTDELLEVREQNEQTVFVPANPDVYQLRPIAAWRFVVNHPGLYGLSVFGPKPVGDVSSDPEEYALYFDNEARAREMRLDVAGLIEIFSGEQQRRIDEYLRSRFHQDFSTKEEWLKFFAQIPRPHPWHMTRVKAEEWIRLLQTWGPSSQYVSNLQIETGLNYSSLEDFMIWLQNPENTRGEDWERGKEVVDAAYDIPEPSPFSTKGLALKWLKLITDQTFDSPEQWVQWWRVNHANLILSADGQKLVSKSK